MSFPALTPAVPGFFPIATRDQINMINITKHGAVEKLD